MSSVGRPVKPGKPVPLDGGVRLEVQPGMGGMHKSHDVQIPLVRKLVVQAADDMQLGRPTRLGFGGARDDLLVAHDVAFGAFQIGAKCAKHATINANVRRVKVRVDVVSMRNSILSGSRTRFASAPSASRVRILIEKDFAVPSNDSRRPASTLARMSARRFSGLVMLRFSNDSSATQYIIQPPPQTRAAPAATRGGQTGRIVAFLLSTK